MAEQSLFWQTTGTGHGPAGGYSQQRLYDWLRKLLVTDQESAEGVLANVGSELQVTGSSSPLSCANGAGVGYGFFYENTSAKSLPVTTPSVGTTGGRINLKVDWTAETATVEVNRNTDGVAAIPSLVQSSGSVWEVPLYTFTITTGGAITLTDVRSFCHFATKVNTLMLDDNNVTNAKLRDSVATSVIGRSASSTGDPADIQATINDRILARVSNAISWVQVTIGMIPDLLITEVKLAAAVAAKLVTNGNSHDHNGGDGAVIPSGGLGANSVIAGKIATGGVSATSQLANDIVDDTKVGNRVPQFYRRQGGNSGAWATVGTTTFTPGAVRIQAGAFDTTPAGSTITFPVAFGGTPLVIVSVNEFNAIFAVTDSIITTQFGCRVYDRATGNIVGGPVHWIAIGPE